MSSKDGLPAECAHNALPERLPVIAVQQVHDKNTVLEVGLSYEHDAGLWNLEGLLTGVCSLKCYHRFNTWESHRHSRLTHTSTAIARPEHCQVLHKYLHETTSYSNEILRTTMTVINHHRCGRLHETTLTPLSRKGPVSYRA